MGHFLVKIKFYLSIYISVNFKRKDFVIYMPQRLAWMDNRMHNSCKRRAEYLRRSLVIVYTSMISGRHRLYWRSCVSSRGAPTPLAHRCHDVKISTHISSVKFKTWWNMGVGHLWLKWVGQLWQSKLSLVFRGVPFPVLAWPRVSVPLNSWPMAYYRKGGTTPRLRLALSEEPSSRLAFTELWIFITKQIGGGAQWVELVITTLTSEPTHWLL